MIIDIYIILNKFSEYIKNNLEIARNNVNNKNIAIKIFKLPIKLELYFFISFIFVFFPPILSELYKYSSINYNTNTLILYFYIFSSLISIYLVIRSFFYSYDRNSIFTIIYKLYSYARNHPISFIFFIFIFVPFIRSFTSLPLTEYILVDKGTFLYSFLYIGTLYPAVYIGGIIIKILNREKKINFSLFSHNICLFFS